MGRIPVSRALSLSGERSEAGGREVIESTPGPGSPWSDLCGSDLSVPVLLALANCGGGVLLFVPLMNPPGEAK